MRNDIRLKVLFWIIPIIIAFTLVLISYELVENWFVELISFGTSFLILGNLIILILAIVYTQKPKFIIVPLLTLLVSWKPISETFAFNLTSKEVESDFTVMSYNVATFNVSRMQNKNSDSLFNAHIYQWLRENESPDILCLQEFYHSDMEDYDNTLDSIVKLGKYKYFYMNPVYKDEFNGVFGVVTFSKFKALKSGKISYGESILNKGTYHDFNIKDDTVRVLNFHLNSMSIRWSDNDSLSWLGNIMHNIGDIYGKLHTGYEKRKVELDEIEKYIDGCNHKIIVCADINSIPHSYTYQRLKSKLENAFEHAGFGLGYTCNRFPWFVRIDNQFYDKRLRINYFKTHSEMKNSDHYPIEAGYSF